MTVYQPTTERPGRRDVQARWDAIADLLPAAPFTSLDVGCAEGWFAHRLAAYGPAIGIDRDERDTRWDGYTLLRETADVDLLTRLGRFDVTLALSVLHHMPDGPEAFNVMRANGGRLFVELPHPSERHVASACDLTDIRRVVQSEGVEIASTPGYDRRHRRAVWLLT